MSSIRRAGYRQSSHSVLLLYNSTQQPTANLEILEKIWMTLKKKKGRARFGHSAHFHTGGKSNHFGGSKRLIFFPLDLPAWRSTSVAPCSEKEDHNWPWPQTAWGAKNCSAPHNQSQSPKQKKKEKKTATEIKERRTVDWMHGGEKAKRLTKRERKECGWGEGANPQRNDFYRTIKWNLKKIRMETDGREWEFKIRRE